MLKNLTLKQTSIFIFFLLLAVGTSFFVASLSIKSEIKQVQFAWTEFQLVRSEKARLREQLHSALGYGGMIHSFKNYILRKDYILLEIAQERIGGVRTILKQYSLLPLSGSENAALNDINTTMNAYQKALFIAKKAVMAGRSSSEIDAQIIIDDTPARRGMKTLAYESLHAKGEMTRVTKSVLIAQLLTQAGYGGMIHNFKNYVLRGEDKYRVTAQADLVKLREIIHIFRGLKIVRGESIALSDLDATLGAYSKALDLIKAMIQKNAKIEEIDAKAKVDDGPALRALDFLILEANQENLTRTHAVDISLKNIAAGEQAVTIAVILVMLCLAIVLMWLLRKQIIAPLNTMSAYMRNIADGHYDIEIPNPKGNNEFASMTKNLQVLLKNSIQRLEAESGLEQANEELNTQLVEVEALREQFEDQASYAVELAETLAMAKEEADLAKVKALADERRTRSIMNTVTDAIITIDPKGLIENFNIGAQTIFGYAPDEVIGRNVSFLMPEPTRSEHDGYLSSFLDGRATRIVGKTVEQVALRKDQTTFPIDLSVNPMYLGDEVSFIGVIRDITTRKESEQEIRRLALTDPLTNLANRNAFNTRFAEALAQSNRRQTHLALLMIDLDKFKPVNDQYGHPVGDALLIEVANCLRHICRETDIIARLGGDEFAVILTDIDDLQSAITPTKKIIAALSQPMAALDQTVQIGASIGIAGCPDDANDKDALITKADNALYASKAAGRNTYRLYGQDKTNKTGISAGPVRC